MICPHCSYEHSSEQTWNDLESYWEQPNLGNQGNFYEMPVKMERTEPDCYTEKVALYACPSCMKTFVEGV